MFLSYRVLSSQTTTIAKCQWLFNCYFLFGGVEPPTQATEDSMFLGKLMLNVPENQEVTMHKKNYKGRCQKKSVSKCKEVARAYSDIQYAYLEVLEEKDDVKEFQCNVLMEGGEEDSYVSDFVCVKTDGDLMVRECVQRKLLTKPLTVKLLDMSREYWLRRGVEDWGIVIDEEK